MFAFTPFSDLEIGREYYISTADGKKYKGIFDEYECSYLNDEEMQQFASFVTKSLSYHFLEEDDFYDVQIIKTRAHVARQNMECRALNMILKRVVNEEFQWL